MSHITLTKWGNSVGIRIPVNELKAANAYIGEQFELSVNRDGSFILKPVKDIQKGWLEAFNAIADSRDDEMMIDNLQNEFDKNEWIW